MLSLVFQAGYDSRKILNPAVLLFSRVLGHIFDMCPTLKLMFYFYFKVPVSQFHQLRYNVAYVLKEMEDLEKKSILKIQD